MVEGLEPSFWVIHNLWPFLGPLWAENVPWSAGTAMLRASASPLVISGPFLYLQFPLKSRGSLIPPKCIITRRLAACHHEHHHW